MKPINPPSIMNGTPEQGVQALKGWGIELANELTYQISQLEAEIEELKAQIEKLKEAQDGV